MTWPASPGSRERNTHDHRLHCRGARREAAVVVTVWPSRRDLATARVLASEVEVRKIESHDANNWMSLEIGYGVARAQRRRLVDALRGVAREPEFAPRAGYRPQRGNGHGVRIQDGSREP